VKIKELVIPGPAAVTPSQQIHAREARTLSTVSTRDHLVSD